MSGKKADPFEGLTGVEREALERGDNPHSLGTRLSPEAVAALNAKDEDDADEDAKEDGK